MHDYQHPNAHRTPLIRREENPLKNRHPQGKLAGVDSLKPLIHIILPELQAQPSNGEVRERPNRAVSKTAVPVTGPWVRIPPSPPQDVKTRHFVFTSCGEISSSCRQDDGSAIFDGEGNMPYLYILLNEAKTRTYTGVSHNVEQRLREHNEGKVKSSCPYRPYRVIYFKEFATLSEARQEEKFYKSAAGRRRLKNMLSLTHSICRQTDNP